MIESVSAHHHAHPRRGPAVLYLNGEPVGLVQARGGDTSWGFGEFSPNDAFGHYAPVYGRWSLLMHAEDDQVPLSSDTVEELARAEEMLASIKAQLLFIDGSQQVDVAELTIDGNLLEWKEY